MSVSWNFFSSLTCGYSMPYCAMALRHASTSVSIDTPTNSTPSGWYWRYMRTTSGASFRQSGHHEAQKSSTTVLPFSWLSLKGFPSGVFSLKSGASVPF